MPVNPNTQTINEHEVPQQQQGITFDQFSGTIRTWGDVTVEGLVTGTLGGTGFANEAADIQHWAVMAPPTPEEARAMHDPAYIASLHEANARMIRANQELRIAGSTAFQRLPEAEVSAAFQQQLQELGQDNGQALLTSIGLWREGRGAETRLSVAASYADCVVRHKGVAVNLSDRLDSKVDGIRAKITYQQGMGTLFVHWVTEPVSKHQLAHGQSPVTTKRVYMNPRIEQQPEVFAALMRRFEDEGLAVVGKMQDRSNELAYHAAQNAQPGQEPSMHMDGIVLSATSADANRMLQITEECYRANVAAFAGRPTPKIAQRVADGIAVADEAAPDGHTAPTSHRAGVMASIANAIRIRLGIVPRQPLTQTQRQQLRPAFELEWRAQTAAAGINPDNFAWNK